MRFIRNQRKDIRLVAIFLPLVLAFSLGCPGEAAKDDTGPGGDTDSDSDSDSNVGTLTSGDYVLNITENDWMTDTCGVTVHVVENMPVAIVITESTLTLMGVWGTVDGGIQEDGSFTMQTTVDSADYSADCEVTLTTESTGQVTGDDAFELYLVTERVGAGDCKIALSDLDELPCTEERVWRLAK